KMSIALLFHRFRLSRGDKIDHTMCAKYSQHFFYKKNVYRRTLIEDRPRLEIVFLAIIELFSFAENL
ncbi:hypothetical protein ACM1RC_27660, partial [Paenibacillus azoreducens]|uniref:hypothetical protein n=1 Tax=Paenibacillus azoreducens TaxID=116718 RepID=UPI0039F4A8BF